MFYNNIYCYVIISIEGVIYVINLLHVYLKKKFKCLMFKKIYNIILEFNYEVLKLK